MRSPQLLLVSGIGEKETINNINVPLIAERPGVGQNMWVSHQTLCYDPQYHIDSGLIWVSQDNVLVGPTFEVDIPTHSSLEQPEYLAQSIQEYNEQRTGMLTNSGGDIAGT